MIRRVQIAKYFRKIKLCSQRIVKSRKKIQAYKNPISIQLEDQLEFVSLWSQNMDPTKNTDPPFSRKAHRSCNPPRTRNDWLSTISGGASVPWALEGCLSFSNYDQVSSFCTFDGYLIFVFLLNQVPVLTVSLLWMWTLKSWACDQCLFSGSLTLPRITMVFIILRLRFFHVFLLNFCPLHTWFCCKILRDVTLRWYIRKKFIWKPFQLTSQWSCEAWSKVPSARRGRRFFVFGQV